MRDIQERFGDQIYRPGDDVEDLTDEEMSERRKEIAEMFASGETDFGGRGED